MSRARRSLPLSVLLVTDLALAGGAGACARARARANRAFAVVLQAPSAGDVTYGVARVRIVRGLRPTASAGQRLFAGSVGGLRLLARSVQWRTLRVSTRVYVVVSRAPGRDSA